MPALRVFGRKTGIAADDLAYPSACGIVIRLIWLVPTLALFAAMMGGNAPTLWYDCDQGLFPVLDTDQVKVIELDDVDRVELYNVLPDETRTFFLTLFVAVAGSIVAYAAMHKIAKTGTVLEYHKRANMPYTVYVVTILMIVEVVLVGFGTWLHLEYNSVAYESKSGATEETVSTEACVMCPVTLQSIYGLQTVSLVILWSDLLIFVLNSIVFLRGTNLRPFGNRPDESPIDETTEEKLQRKAQMWENKCKRVCCMLECFTCNLSRRVTQGQNSERAFQEVAEVMSRWFTDTKFVFSDFVVSILLLGVEQKHEEEQRLLAVNQAWKQSSSPPPRKGEKLKNHVIRDSRPALVEIEHINSSHGLEVAEAMEEGLWSSKVDPAAMQFMDDAIKYSPFMLSILGWKIVVLQRPGRFLCDYSTGVVYSSKPIEHDGGTLGLTNDNCCGHYYTSFRVNGFNRSQIIGGNVVSTPAGNIPYAIVVDHTLKSVVVTLRATMELGDFLTDAMCSPKELEEAGNLWGFDGKGHYAHSGFLSSAMTIRDDIHQSQTLRRVLDGEIEIQGKSCEGYQVMVVGVSLGAGVAAVLSLLLRNEFRGTRCFAYSCPGCVFDLDLAEKAQEWIDVSFVGKDLVPHLRWENLFQLRLRMLEMMLRCKANKSKVWKTLYKDIHMDELLQPLEDVPDTVYTETIRAKIRDLQKRRSFHLEQIPLYIPGRVLHLTKLKSHKRTKVTLLNQVLSKRAYVPMWLQDRTNVDEIKVSSRMLFDHMPIHMINIMKEITANHHASERKAPRAQQVVALQL